MVKLIASVVILASFLYLIIDYIRKNKPYKVIVLSTFFVALAVLILTTLTYLF